MKKLFVVALAALFACNAFAGTPVSTNELPKAARAFIAKYFAGVNVRKAEKDNGRRGMEYEVDFASGAEAEFTADGEWKEVKAARGNSVPSEIVPAAIVKYVNDNFAGLTIVEIARKRGGYEVELSNGTELKLTADAKPMQPRQGNGRGRH